MRDAPTDTPAAWRGAALARAPETWTVHLAREQAADLVRAAARARAAGKTLQTLAREDFDLPTLGAAVREWSARLDRGLGFVLLRGFPTDELGPDDAALAYLGLGLQLGTAVPQNLAGDLVCHVRDQGVPRTGPQVRLYTTREEQGFHTDGADVIGLLCLQRARSGGLSRIVSSVAIHAELRARRPELVPLLFEPWAFLGEFPFELPICSVHEGRLRTFYVGWYIRDAQRAAGAKPLTGAQVELLALVEELANDPAFHLDMDLQPGDVQLLNNATILHARTAYTDDPDRPAEASGSAGTNAEGPRRRRHLLRLWLSPHAFSSVEPALAAGVPRP